MNDIRGIKVEWCDLCPRARCCKYKVKGIYVLSDSCPLPPWPNISEADLHSKAIQIFDDSNLGQMHILYLLKELLKSIGVIVEEGK